MFTKFVRAESKGICSKQDSDSFLHKKIVSLCISYELDRF